MYVFHHVHIFIKWVDVAKLGCRVYRNFEQSKAKGGLLLGSYASATTENIRWCRREDEYDLLYTIPIVNGCCTSTIGNN
jgi:hypothetical protein